MMGLKEINVATATGLTRTEMPIRKKYKRKQPNVFFDEFFKKLKCWIINSLIDM